MGVDAKKQAEKGEEDKKRKKKEAGERLTEKDSKTDLDEEA